MAENITGTGALSRRDFLTGSAVAAAGAAMLGLAAAEPAVAAEVRSGQLGRRRLRGRDRRAFRRYQRHRRRRHLPRA